MKIFIYFYLTLLIFPPQNHMCKHQWGVFDDYVKVVVDHLGKTQSGGFGRVQLQVITCWRNRSSYFWERDWTNFWSLEAMSLVQNKIQMLFIFWPVTIFGLTSYKNYIEGVIWWKEVKEEVKVSYHYSRIKKIWQPWKKK